MGATVGADHRMVKTKTYDRAGNKRTVWKRVEKPVRGLYIGWRTVCDGRVDYLGFDEGYAFLPEDYLEVWLVVENERHNPIHIRPEDCRTGG